MEYFKGIQEDPLINSFLNRFPDQDLGEIIKKTLKYGIYSMNTYESLCCSGNSPRKTLFSHREVAEDQIPVNSYNESYKLEDTTPSSTKEITRIYRNESKLPKRKQKDLSQVPKKPIKRTTPRSARNGLSVFIDKHSFTKLITQKALKSSERPKKTSKASLKEKPSATIESKRSSVEDKQDEARSYTNSFNSLTSKILESYIFPKTQNKTPSNESTSMLKQCKRGMNLSIPSRIHRSVVSSKRKNEIKSDAFAYVTSSSEEPSL